MGVRDKYKLYCRNEWLTDEKNMKEVSIYIAGNVCGKTPDGAGAAFSLPKQKAETFLKW